MPRELLSRRSIHVTALAAVAVATVGFLTGTRQAPSVGGYRGSEQSGEHASERSAPPAPRYADMGSVRRGPRWRAQAEALAALRPREEPAERPAATAQERSEALEARRARRAYDGAPPTVPHPIDQAGYPACLSCHATGLRLGVRVAAAMSHEHLSNCLQCHASELPRVPTGAMVGGVPEENAFTGLASVPAPPRPWSTAPPVMPHGTLMRGECTSCHGGLATGIHTTHPARQSCTQCHGASAILNQQPVTGVLQAAGLAGQGPLTLGPGGAAP